jgi:hypothetical protein
MKTFKYIYCSIIALCVWSQVLFCTPKKDQRSFENPPATPALQQGERMLSVGEELEYSVHYSFFDIGKIVFKVTEKEVRKGRTVYHASAWMDSNPSLTWLVDLHVRFHGEIDQDAFSYGWVSEDSTSKKVTYRKMIFDYENHKMYFSWMEKFPSGEQKQLGADTIAITKRCQDGLSLFYYAREHVLEKMHKDIPTFIDTNEVMTKINFGVERGEEEIEAVDFPVDVIKLEGRADFEGIFGLTGGFDGVFSNDVASIPITARLKVILGSVRVELRKWKRGDWIPPKSTNEN